MDNAAFEDYIETRYKKQMEFYSKASAKNQKRYRLFQWVLIVLSALTPVFAALNGKKIGDTTTIHIDVVVIIISAIVAILTSVLKTFNYQELWITYRATYEKLKPEIHYYHFSVGPYSADGVDKESLFVTRVEALLDKEHSQWPASKKSSDTSQDAKSNQQNKEGEAPAHE